MTRLACSACYNLRVLCDVFVREFGRGVHPHFSREGACAWYCPTGVAWRTMFMYIICVGILSRNSPLPSGERDCAWYRPTGAA